MAPPMTLVYNYTPPTPAVEASAPATNPRTPTPTPAVQAVAPAPPRPVHQAPGTSSPEPMAVDPPPLFEPPAESGTDGGDMDWESLSVTAEIREGLTDLSLDQVDDDMTDIATFNLYQQHYVEPRPYPPLSGYIEQHKAQASQLPANQSLRLQQPHLFLRPSELIKRRELSPERLPARHPVPPQPEYITCPPVVSEPIVIETAQPIATQLNKSTVARPSQAFRLGNNTAGSSRLTALLLKSNIARRRRELTIDLDHRHNLFDPSHTAAQASTASVSAGSAGTAAPATAVTIYTVYGTSASASASSATPATSTAVQTLTGIAASGPVAEASTTSGSAGSATSATATAGSALSHTAASGPAAEAFITSGSVGSATPATTTSASSYLFHTATSGSAAQASTTSDSVTPATTATDSPLSYTAATGSTRFVTPKTTGAGPTFTAVPGSSRFVPPAITAAGRTKSGTTASASAEPARATTLTPIINGPRARKRRAQDTEHQLVVSFQVQSPEQRRKRPMVSPRGRREQNRNVFTRLAYTMISNIVAAASGIGRSVSDRITRIFVRDNHGIDETRGIDRDGNSYVKRRRLHIEEPGVLSWVPAAQFEDRVHDLTTITTAIWHAFFTFAKVDPIVIDQTIAPLHAPLAAIPLPSSSLGQTQLSGKDLILAFANCLVDVRDKLYSFNKFRRVVRNSPTGCTDGTLWFGLATDEKNTWKYVNDVLSSPEFSFTMMHMARLAQIDVEARHLADMRPEHLERVILDIEAAIEDMAPPSYIASDDYRRRVHQHLSSPSLEPVHTPAPVMPGTFIETAPSEQEPMPAEYEPITATNAFEPEFAPVEQETTPSDAQLMHVDRDITTSDERPHPFEREIATAVEKPAPAEQEPMPAEHETAASRDQSAPTDSEPMPTEHGTAPSDVQRASSSPESIFMTPGMPATPNRPLPPLPESFYTPRRAHSPHKPGNPGLTPPPRRRQQRLIQSESLSLEVHRMTLNPSTIIRTKKTKRLRGQLWRQQELKAEAAHAELHKRLQEEAPLRHASAERQQEFAAQQLELPEDSRLRLLLRDDDPTHKKIEEQYITDFEPHTPMNTREKPILRSVLKGRVTSPSTPRKTRTPRMGTVSTWVAKRMAADLSRPRPAKSVRFADGIFSPQGRHMDLIVRRRDLFDTLSQASDDKGEDDEDKENDEDAQKAEAEKEDAVRQKILALFDSQEPLVGMEMSTEAANRIRLHKEQLAKDAEEKAQLAAAEARAVEEAARRAAEEEARRKLQERLELTHGLRLPEKPLVCPLSDDWLHRAEETLHAATTTTLATTSEGIDLRRHDFARVVPETEWLNDEIVNGTLAWLDKAINTAAGIKDYRKQTRKCLAMSSFFWKQIAERGVAKTERTLKRCGVHSDNFLDVETILVPVCESSHWTLVVIRPTKRTIAHMDSLNPRGSRQKTELATALVKHILADKFVEEEWKVVVHEAPRQTNGWDCGVHTVTNGMCVALGLNPVDCYSAVDMPLQRLRIAATLLNQGFSGDFDLRVF